MRTTVRLPDGLLREAKQRASMSTSSSWRGRVTHVQVAIDGRWESAARAVVDEPGSGDALDELVRPLRELGECAIEAFARDDDGLVSFCGVRFREIRRTDAHEITESLWDVARTRGPNLCTIMEWWTHRLDRSLFDGTWTAVDVGVVDAWLTCGAVRVYPTTPFRDSAHARERLLDAAARTGAVARPSVVAAEFLSETPIPHWVGIEIAQRTAQGAITASATIDAAAQDLSELPTGPIRMS